MITLCEVTGSLVTSDGVFLSEGTVSVLPDPVIVRGDGDTTIIPEPVSVQTDVDAQFSISLAPGTYRMTYRDLSGNDRATFGIEVPPLPAISVEAIRVGSGPRVIIMRGGGAADLPSFEIVGGDA
jgi:hypothetical protein